MTDIEYLSWMILNQLNSMTSFLLKEFCHFKEVLSLKDDCPIQELK
jgi:hypothetical protein